jgi:RNA polymerase sigma-B factor
MIAPRPAHESCSDGEIASRRTRRANLRPVTTRDTARTLLREYHEHGDLGARERLIQQYMPLVKSLARRHSRGGEQYEDLVQVGCIGLIKAVDRFDPARAEFGAFAIPNVAGEIKRYLRDRAGLIRIPRRLQEVRQGVFACSAELSAQLERPATVTEIAERSGVAEPEVAAALEADRAQSPVSLSAPETQAGDNGCGDLEPQFEGGYERGEQRALLASGFRVLDARERRLLHLRYFAGLSQPQIAREVGLSQLNVSRLTRRALVKLRAEIGPLESAPSRTAAGGR